MSRRRFRPPSFRSRGALPLVAIVLSLMLTVCVAFAKQGVVTTKSGEKVEGDVVEQADFVTITSKGVQRRIARADVESITYGGKTARELFQERRAALAEKDLPGRLELARWAMSEHEYQLAMEAANEALAIDSSSAEVRSLIGQIRTDEAAYRRERAAAAKGGADGAAPAGQAPAPGVGKPAPPTGSAPGAGSIGSGASPADGTSGAAHPTDPAAPAGTTPEPASGAASPPSAPVERRFLTPGDIQEIRQQELRSTDRVPVQIPNDVKRNFATRHGMEFAEFDSRPLVEQAMEIIEKGDELRAQVKISGDPDAIREFKAVQRSILTGCAASNCHGGQNGGDFVLFNETSDAATYTNFYLLSRYSRKTGSGKGIFGGAAERKMIERGRGEQSLLVQYGLPVSLADADHPPVKGNPVKPLFRNKEDRNYERVVKWMNSVLKPIAPQYRIQYNPPKPGAAAQPNPPPTTAGSKP